MLIDIGVNLWHRRFERDREDVIQRAQSAGIKYQILTGTSLATSQQNLGLCQQYTGLYTTVGVHPHDAGRVSDDYLLTLGQLASHSAVVAIGETGLDFNRKFTPPEIQKQVFAQQVQLACELKRPLFVHERDAHFELLAILDKFADQLPAVVIHCFTGNQQSLENYLERGFYIGITGWICDQRRGLDLQTQVSLIPQDRLMLETDAPFLTPRNMPTKPAEGRNEPAFLIYVLEKTAQCLNIEPEALARISSQNSLRFFQIIDQ